MATNDASQLNIRGIEATAEVVRRRVTDAPEDVAARLDLAWDLFILALHRTSIASDAPQQGLAHELSFVPGGAGNEAGQDPTTGGPPRGSSLLAECAHHLAVVQHLDSDSYRLSDSSRLELLIDLVGGRTTLETAREDVSRSAQVVATDMSR